MIAQFRNGAQLAIDAGFDGVEIHAANGYLLDQFLRDRTNRRTDIYGGSIENRARLLLETVGAVTKIWGHGHVGVRISPTNPFNDMYDSDPEKMFGYVAEQLGRFGLSYLHVVEADEHGETTGHTVDFRRLGKVFGGTYLANGGFDYARAQASIEHGDTDLVSFGRLFLANPDLPERTAKSAGSRRFTEVMRTAIPTTRYSAPKPPSRPRDESAW